MKKLEEIVKEPKALNEFFGNFSNTFLATQDSMNLNAFGSTEPSMQPTNNSSTLIEQLNLIKNEITINMAKQRYTPILWSEKIYSMLCEYLNTDKLSNCNNLISGKELKLRIADGIRGFLCRSYAVSVYCTDSLIDAEHTLMLLLMENQEGIFEIIFDRNENGMFITIPINSKVLSFLVLIKKSQDARTLKAKSSHSLSKIMNNSKSTICGEKADQRGSSNSKIKRFQNHHPSLSHIEVSGKLGSSVSPRTSKLYNLSKAVEINLDLNSKVFDFIKYKDKIIDAKYFKYMSDNTVTSIFVLNDGTIKHEIVKDIQDLGENNEVRLKEFNK